MVEGYVGFVEDLFVYPFTGMRGVGQEHIFAVSSSIVGDRQHTLVAIDGPKRTQTPNTIHSTQFPDLMLYQAHFKDPRDPTSQVEVVSPEGKEYAATDLALLDELSDKYGASLALVSTGRHGGYSGEVAINTNGSIDTITRLAGLESTDPQRFRPNVLVHANNPEPNLVNQEAAWRNWLLSFESNNQSPMLAVTREIDRCKTIIYDPQSLDLTPGLLAAIPRDSVNPKKKYIGVYGKIVQEGRLHRGDTVQKLLRLPVR